jgi:hypothetical protein
MVSAKNEEMFENRTSFQFDWKRLCRCLRHTYRKSAHSYYLDDK